MSFKLTCAGFATFILFCSLTAGKERVKSHTRHLPAIDVYDLKDSHSTLKRVCRGKVTIIDCWFIPCPPCFKEMDLMHEIYFKYKNSKDVQVISICRSDTVVFRKFLQNDPHLATFTGWFHEYSKQQQYALPTYFIPHCNERIGTGDNKYPSKGPDDKTKCPDKLFKFRGYPTVIITDKKGNIIFQKTGYEPERRAFYKSEISKAIQQALAE